MASQEISGKYSLELNFLGDGSIFLNFWDEIHGNDVVAEVGRSRLWVTPEGEEHPYSLSFREYLNRVIESISKRTV